MHKDMTKILLSDGDGDGDDDDDDDEKSSDSICRRFFQSIYHIS